MEATYSQVYGQGWLVAAVAATAALSLCACSLSDRVLVRAIAVNPWADSEATEFFCARR
jgi:hypothetical protein